TFAGEPGHLYYVTKSSMSFAAAEAQAQLMGGHVVAIRNVAEDQFVSQIVHNEFGSDPPFWIGATDDAAESVFRWTDGEPLTFSHWWYGEPNNYWYDGGENQVLSNWGSVGYWND